MLEQIRKFGIYPNFSTLEFHMITEFYALNETDFISTFSYFCFIAKCVKKIKVDMPSPTFSNIYQTRSFFCHQISTLTGITFTSCLPQGPKGQVHHLFKCFSHLFWVLYPPKIII